MAEKTTHFGRAGEYHAMSELLLRGWNVAVPVVDVGDDAFVIDDRSKTVYRVQVKSAQATCLSKDDERWKADFSLNRDQLRTLQEVELFYLLLARCAERWRFFVIPRPALANVRQAQIATPRSGPGRPMLADEDATTKGLMFSVTIQKDSASGWGADLTGYLDAWPDELTIVPDGPGSRRVDDP
ncbi:group I intron-associated PD-(D/E)XK endonuclease [Nannocystis punicea]|uniref:Group I intron-associated PD-(D/E)XK endonuclease n=1 Tax=Nannocystis punicea TaxID=2995304 RepID=A0ABY7HHM9_9BACT|nr:group I intron-associated PD-(D/E)XK endonuclease [Nannocystis poenicansa]WAS98812.1 group I intron-associated PD-(D/E)XK endonuclease [Nannocystis poenicansa]